MNPIGMHYGFWSHNWDEIAYIPLMEKLAWLGFDICEVASAEWGYYDDARLRELKACADHNGLGITYSIGLEAKYDLASDDPAVRENGIRHVTRILESMPKVGATILNGVSYAGWQALPDHGITLDEKRRKEELALESMSRLMKVAENCGVLYCCEVVNRFEQYLLNTAKEGVEFVKRLGSPNARVLLDTFHMNIEEDSMVDAILEAGPWLGHFHVGENNRRPAGSTNRLPWKDMAAALKQVPSCEFFPMEAVKTNVIGSNNVIDACVENRVKKAIFLSTDKAAYPINAMGMSKAMMEKNVIARSKQMLADDPVLCLTRYGNVMASRGSVIPLFCDQIDEGKSLTVTNPNMTRFMMTLSDAVDLVLYAFEHGKQGDLFVQKAPAATIETLAQAVLELKQSDLGVQTIGTRHGEKLFEVLVTSEEMLRAEDLPGFFRIHADSRDLNYDNYFSKGNAELSQIEPYTSHNTQRLDLDGMKRLLQKLKLFGGNC